MSYYDYERALLNQMEQLRMQLLARPLNLGGVSSTGGGAGGPPGGFLGYLPQSRVAYDQSELAASGTSVSGSLLDNLNHIRYRLNQIETELSGTLVVEEAQIGVGNNKVIINQNGITLSGNATTYKDLLYSLIGQRLEAPGSGIVQNNAEGTLTFKGSATLTDYVTMPIQLQHEWKVGSNVYPHIHWFQADANMPNWLVQYRWQKQGSQKTTSWTNLPYSGNAFTYSGTINQITSFPAIIPPSGAYLSDIVQFRIIRDSDNDSTLFGGADVVGDVEAVNFDIRIEVDSLGSNQEYVK